MCRFRFHPPGAAPLLLWAALCQLAPPTSRHAAEPEAKGALKAANKAL